MTFLIRSQGKNILIDAGVGAHGLWRFGEGHLLDSLKELDVSAEEIDFVVPTHLHLDHVGWFTRSTPEGPVPTFPNAQYLFQQADWDYLARIGEHAVHIQAERGEQPGVPRGQADRGSFERFGEARELIGATLLLASDGAGSFITGEELIVDGGYHAMTI